MTACTCVDSRAKGPSRESWPRAAGNVIGDDDAKRIWQQLSAGLWNGLATLDEDGFRHVVIQAQSHRCTVDWLLLGARECQLLDLVACDCPRNGRSVRAPFALHYQSAYARCWTRRPVRSRWTPTCRAMWDVQSENYAQSC